MAAAGAVLVNAILGTGPAAQAEAVDSESVSVARQVGVDDSTGSVDVIRELEPLAELAASRRTREDAEAAALFAQAAADQAVLDQQHAAAEAAAQQAAEEAAAQAFAAQAFAAQAAGSVAASAHATISNSAGAINPPGPGGCGRRRQQRPGGRLDHPRRHAGQRRRPRRSPVRPGRGLHGSGGRGAR